MSWKLGDAYEHVERLLRLIVKELQNEPASKKDRLDQIQRVIDQITSTMHKLVELYDNARKDEIAGEISTCTKALCYRLKEVTAECDEQWANGKVDGWKYVARENGHVSEPNTSIDLDYYSTVDELVEPSPAKLMQNCAVATQHQNDVSEQIALLGVKIEKLCEILSEKTLRTKENIEKKLAQINEIINAEREDEEVPDINSDNEDQKIYNPLKLPKDSNGNSIPYWLYKLRALGQEFKCETCGNFYWGKRSYERHFSEFQHQDGVRRLGTPST